MFAVLELSHGFVHVINFGVSPATEAAAFAASSALFAQPETHKLEKLARITPQTNTGFSPFAFEALNRARPPDLKEAFNVRDPTIHSNDWSGRLPRRLRGGGARALGGADAGREAVRHRMCAGARSGERLLCALAGAHGPVYAALLALPTVRHAVRGRG